jgi:hypothetical protein
MYIDGGWAMIVVRFTRTRKDLREGGKSEVEENFRLLALCFRCRCLPSTCHIIIARHVSVQVLVNWW